MTGNSNEEYYSGEFYGSVLSLNKSPYNPFSNPKYLS
jgi:hypothetical protein